MVLQTWNETLRKIVKIVERYTDDLLGCYRTVYSFYSFKIFKYLVPTRKSYQKLKYVILFNIEKVLECSP